MAAVDKGDQSRGYYHCRIKKRKFYKYIYIYILLSLWCDHHEHFHPLPGMVSSHWNYHQAVQVQLAKELIGGYCNRYRAGYNGSLIKPCPFSHFPMKITAASPGQRNWGHCTYCYQQKKRCDSQWYCHECGVWLCHPGNDTKDCFLLWHQKCFSFIGTIRWCIIFPVCNRSLGILFLCATVLSHSVLFT